MKPIDFKESTTILAKDQQEYEPLPVFQDGSETISCWELDDDNIECLKKTRKFWFRQMNFGKALQPQLPMVVSPFGDRPKSIEEVPAAEKAPEIGPMETFQVTWNYDPKVVIGLLTVKRALLENLEMIADSVIAPGYEVDMETGKVKKIFTFALIEGKTYDKTTHAEKMKEKENGN